MAVLDLETNNQLARTIGPASGTYSVFQDGVHVVEVGVVRPFRCASLPEKRCNKGNISRAVKEASDGVGYGHKVACNVERW